MHAQKRFKKLLNKRNWIKLSVITITTLFIVAELFSLSTNPNKTTLSKEQTIKDYAKSVMEKCKNASYKPSCYDKEIPKLMDVLSMRDAFGVAKVVGEYDKEYTHCHVLGHYLSGRETKKDPSKWKDVIAQCPANVCNNGCLHGPLLAKFNSETLTDKQIEQIKPDLIDVCEPRGNWHPSQEEIAMCYHGMGHLNMYATGADIRKSVRLCEEEGTKNDGRSYVQTCVQGVFMQIYQPLEAEDIALVKKLTQTKDTVLSFCNQFSGESWGACHRESWPLFNQEIQQPKGANAFCSYSQDSVERRKCYSTVMSSMTVNLLLANHDMNKFKLYCDGLDSDQVDYCYSDAANRLIQIDPSANLGFAISVCNIAPHNGDLCFSAMTFFAYGLFPPNSDELKSYCSSLPLTWKQKCLTGNIKPN